MRRLIRGCIRTFSLGFSNLDSWIHSPRTVFMLLAILLICYTAVSRDHLGIRNALMASGSSVSSVSSAELVFLESFRGFNFQFSTMTFLVMMSTFPKRYTYQEWCMIRSSRTKWFHGQILYALMISLFYILLLTAFTFLFSGLQGEKAEGWSDFFLSGEVSYTLIWIPEEFFARTTPQTATLLLYVPLLLCWFTICMILMAFNLFDRPGAGLATIALLLISNYIFVQADIPFHPLRYACGSYFYDTEDVVGETWKMLRFYLLTIGFLYLIMRIRLQRMDITAAETQKQ